MCGKPDFPSSLKASFHFIAPILTSKASPYIIHILCAYGPVQVGAIRMNVTVNLIFGWMDGWMDVVASATMVVCEIHVT